MPALPATAELPWHRQRLRVPRDDESLFARPPLPQVPDVASRNHDLLQAASVSLQGRTLAQLRDWSRQQACVAAREYTGGLIGELPPSEEFDRLYVGGHQPTLFHPGVWVKNFAIAALAARSGGTALNLVVDNDTLSSTRLLLPAGDRIHPVIETLPFDADRPPQPWEEAQVIDRPLFESFGERVVERMQSAWDFVPLAGELWSDAVAHLDRSPLLRDCLTASRHLQERRWGVSNLELPISRLCRLDPFLWFASHLLAQLPRFREIHNQVLYEYRQVNRIRSHTHPVPELKETGGWLEAPFWVWREGDRQRGRLFARQVGREVVLSDGRDEFARLPLSPEMDACCAVERLRELPAQGIRLRTRALTTTLFARLCLADLFVHGVGGATYDEMTDRIIARFFGLPAPGFLTLSATLHLPLAEPHHVTPEDERRLRGLLRELEYHADRHLTPGFDPETDALRAEKERLIAEQQAADRGELNFPTRRQERQASRERFRRFQEVNRRLAARTTDQRRRIEDELTGVRRRLEANAILQHREFSFCLYPAEKLRRFMTTLGAG